MGLNLECVGDEYASGEHRWWHLSSASPELIEALDSGWLHRPGRVLDLGCGLGSETAYLAELGFDACGVDISRAALAGARELHPGLELVRADVRALPFADATCDFLLDRGTFHYLKPADRARYAREARRVLRPNGRFLLRACLRSRGSRNAMSEEAITDAFEGWRMVSTIRADIPSDTRLMPALVVRMERDGI
jgi:SAM-dependent methyltransferase